MKRRGGEAGGGKRKEERRLRGPANTDKYFIPQHTESLRLEPRGGREDGGRQRDIEKS